MGFNTPLRFDFGLYNQYPWLCRCLITSEIVKNDLSEVRMPTKAEDIAGGGKDQYIWKTCKNVLALCRWNDSNDSEQLLWCVDNHCLRMGLEGIQRAKAAHAKCFSDMCYECHFSRAVGHLAVQRSQRALSNFCSESRRCSKKIYGIATETAPSRNYWALTKIITYSFNINMIMKFIWIFVCYNASQL